MMRHGRRSVQSKRLGGGKSSSSSTSRGMLVNKFTVLAYCSVLIVIWIGLTRRILPLAEPHGAAQPDWQLPKISPHTGKQPPSHGHRHSTVRVSDDGSQILSQCTPTHKACHGFDGVLHIRSGDYGGASGTIFFQFVIAQLMYADAHNLLPWIHLDEFSHLVYDPIVHGRSDAAVMVRLLKGMEVSTIQDARRNHAMYPGRPVRNETALTDHTYAFAGTGVWNHYFQPISEYCPGDRSCDNAVPYITMENYHISPGLHRYAPWSPKVWRYGNMPSFIAQPHIPLSRWLLPQRQRAAAIVRKYDQFRVQPWLEELSVIHADDKCLGMHIRWSDKAGTRRLLQIDEFLPYVLEYMRQRPTKACIYLATDSTKVIESIHATWPQEVQSKLQFSSSTIRSSDTTAVFDMESHHRTNSEVLRDILDLSKCAFLIGGKSAVTESAIYWNPALIFQSINLEDPSHLSVQTFGDLVGKVVQGEITDETWSRYKSPPGWWEEGATKDSNIHKACSATTNTLWNVTQPISNGAEQWTPATKISQRLFIHLPNAFHAIESKQESAAVGFNDPLWKAWFRSDAWITSNAVATSAEASMPCGQIFPFGDEQITDRSIFPSTSYLGSKRGKASADMTIPYTEWMQQMRQVARPVFQKFYSSVRPSIRNEASRVMQRVVHNGTNDDVAPFPRLHDATAQAEPSSSSAACLGLHIPDPGYHRNRKLKQWISNAFPEDTYLDYLRAFRRAGGSCVYLATDSHSMWEDFRNTTIVMHGQWNAVRNREHIPIHYMEEDLVRIGSEMLVDVINLSRTLFLVHASHPMSDGVLFWNSELEHLHVDDPNRIGVEEFETEIRRRLGE